jgi:hypothetical protein
MSRSKPSLRRGSVLFLGAALSLLLLVRFPRLALFFFLPDFVVYDEEFTFPTAHRCDRFRSHPVVFRHEPEVDEIDNFAIGDDMI